MSERRAAQYRSVDGDDVPASPGQHPAASRYDKGIGEALGVAAFGLYQVDLPAGAATVRHDHLDDGAEDVYAVLDGSGTVVIDGESVAVRSGRFIAVSPAASREVRAGDDGLVFIAICATPQGHPSR